MVQKASPKLTEMMNQAIAGELQAIVQYMWHHVMVKGFNSASLMDVFDDIAIEEMKHAEKIAERLFYFDVAPTTKPNPIAKGGSAEQMLLADVKAEEEAITLTRPSSSRLRQRVMTQQDCFSKRYSRMRNGTTIRSRRCWESRSLPVVTNFKVQNAKWKTDLVFSPFCILQFSIGNFQFAR